MDYGDANSVAYQVEKNNDLNSHYKPALQFFYYFLSKIEAIFSIY